MIRNNVPYNSIITLVVSSQRKNFFPRRSSEIEISKAVSCSYLFKSSWNTLMYFKRKFLCEMTTHVTSGNRIHRDSSRESEGKKGSEIALRYSLKFSSAIVEPFFWFSTVKVQAPFLGRKLL